MIMATSDKQWNKAFNILSEFERQLISPELFKWDYFLEKLSVSKATLWRNQEFRDEFNKVRKLCDKYKKGTDYSLEKSLDADKDIKIKRLEATIEELRQQLDRERERLAYATMIARQKDIDPNEFLENSPLVEHKPKASKEDGTGISDDDVLAMIHKNRKG